jgi:hypothetical protein
MLLLMIGIACLSQSGNGKGNAMAILLGNGIDI